MQHAGECRGTCLLLHLNRNHIGRNMDNAISGHHLVVIQIRGFEAPIVGDRLTIDNCLRVGYRGQPPPLCRLVKLSKNSQTASNLLGLLNGASAEVCRPRNLLVTM